MTKARIRQIRAASAANSAHQAIINELLAEIERVNAFTRRGNLPNEEPEEEVLPQKANARHNEFIDLFAYNYELHFRQKYKVSGGKDGAAAKRLLTFESDPIKLVTIAMQAWQHPEKFNCNRAVTISAFDSVFNEVVAELKTLNGHARPIAPAGCKL